MKRSIPTLAALAMTVSVVAQSYVHQVVVLNEGYYDMSTQTQVEPVTLGSYDPANGTYQSMATITGPRFASDVEVDGMAIYVAADDKLLKYDRDNFQLLGQVTVTGIRKIALWNGQVLLTRGELGGLPHYFEVRNANDLSLNYFLDTSDGPAYSCEDVEVVGNTAYLAVSNAFDWANLVGLIGRVDLTAQTYMGDIDLGPNGKNPENIMVTPNAIYSLNNKDFTASSLSRIDISTSIVDYTDTIAKATSCGASVMAESVQKIYFQEYAVNQLARFDLNTASVLDTLNTISYYGLADDALNGVLYATSTDFVTSGVLHVLQYDGTQISQVPVDVSPGNMALDVRSSVGISETDKETFSISPNPATEFIDVSGPIDGTLELLDAKGRILPVGMTKSGATTRLNVASLPAGVYHVRNGGVSHSLVITRK